MDYTVKENALLIKLGSRANAKLAFHVEGKKMHFDSTYTPQEFRGKGIGSQLMQAGIDYAKKMGFIIVPVCSFSVEYFKKHPEYADLLWKQ
jgi:hypothetical protein